MSGEPVFFGVRHLSPAGAFHLRRLLDDVRPRIVLVEAPADLEPLLPDIVRPGTQPPIAILAYTREPPVRSLLYPLAEYSPEYQAILWAREHCVPCRFMDLPSDVFLALSTGDGIKEEPEGDVEETVGERDTPDGRDERETHDLFWERVLEHAADGEGYRLGAAAYGKQLRLREETENRDARREHAEVRIREAHMRRIMDQAVAAGVPAERMVVVTGAYHLEGLRSVPSMTDAELATLPRRFTACTLMPYTSYRLSSRSGYGAGARAPAYSSMIWQGLHRQEPRWHVRAYLTRIARFLRQEGHSVSTANVIEAVRLADALARLRGFDVPALPDLRDAAITCLGGGSLVRISRAVAARFRQRLAEAGSPAAVAVVIEDAFACGMATELHRAAAALQALSTEATDLADLAGTAARLSFVLRFGDVRRMDTRPLEPLLQQIFLRCCLLLPAACDCDDKSAGPVLSAMDSLDGVARAHAVLDEAFWLRMLED